LKSWTQPADALKGNCLLSTFHVEKLSAILSFSNVNKGRTKINKCKNLKDKWNFTASKGIIDMAMKKVTSLTIKPIELLNITVTTFMRLRK
jgi:hypothetical protein